MTDLPSWTVMEVNIGHLKTEISNFLFIFSVPWVTGHCSYRECEPSEPSPGSQAPPGERAGRGENRAHRVWLETGGGLSVLFSCDLATCSEVYFTPLWPDHCLVIPHSGDPGKTSPSGWRRHCLCLCVCVTSSPIIKCAGPHNIHTHASLCPHIPGSVNF